MFPLSVITCSWEARGHITRTLFGSSCGEELKTVANKQPTKNQILPTKTCVILEVDPSSVGTSDETSTSADSLTTTLGETFSQNV